MAEEFEVERKVDAVIDLTVETTDYLKKLEITSNLALDNQIKELLENVLDKMDSIDGYNVKICGFEDKKEHQTATLNEVKQNPEAYILDVQIEIEGTEYGWCEETIWNSDDFTESHEIKSNDDLLEKVQDKLIDVLFENDFDYYDIVAEETEYSVEWSDVLSDLASEYEYEYEYDD